MERDHEKQRPRVFRGPVNGVISLVILVAIVISGVVVVIWNGAGGAATAPPTSTSTPADTAVTIPPAARSVCGLAGYDTTGSLERVPPVASWEFVGLIQIPSAPHTSGPGTIDPNGYPSCFAHTVDGAVLAAASYLGDTTSAELVRTMAENGIVPGAGRDATLQRLSYGRAAAGSSARLSIKGVRVLSYTADRAVIDLALVADTGDMFGDVFTLAWSDGDWKIVLTDDGLPPVPITVLSTLGGYLPWGAP